MAELPITMRQIEAFQRFVNRLPHQKDIDLVILKAHLLMEEQVNAMARERLQNPDVLLGDENLESRQRIELAQSLFPPNCEPWIWETLLKLNALRNQVAHNIDPKGRGDRMEDIVRRVAQNLDSAGQSDIKEAGKNSAPDTEGDGPSPAQHRFEAALWFLFEAVSSLVERAEAPVIGLVRRDKE